MHIVALYKYTLILTVHSEYILSVEKIMIQEEVKITVFSSTMSLV